MDKRIIKTKNALKTALMELIKETPFEKVTVTQLCQKAGASRITFYTYYGDKYELLEECYTDMLERAVAVFNELQAKNNPDHSDVEKALENLVDSILVVVHNHFMNHTHLLTNPDLLFSYYRFVLEHIEAFESEYRDRITTKYPIRRLNAFLILGSWGFIHLAGPHSDPDEWRKYLKPLLLSMIKSCAKFDSN